MTKHTCYKSLKGSIKDLILTNRPRNIQKTSLYETGLSDCHKPIFTILKSTFKELPPPQKKKSKNKNKQTNKQITRRSCKDFNEIKLCYDLDQELLKGKMYNHGINSYSKFTEIFSNTLEKHAPLKFKTIRNVQIPFMTKKLTKAIMNKSRLRNDRLDKTSWLVKR